MFIRRNRDVEVLMIEEHISVSSCHRCNMSEYIDQHLMREGISMLCVISVGQTAHGKLGDILTKRTAGGCTLINASEGQGW